MSRAEPGPSQAFGPYASGSHGTGPFFGWGACTGGDDDAYSGFDNTQPDIIGPSQMMDGPPLQTQDDPYMTPAQPSGRPPRQIQAPEPLTYSADHVRARGRRVRGRTVAARGGRMD
jgi:hypothetical protein